MMLKFLIMLMLPLLLITVSSAQMTAEARTIQSHPFVDVLVSPDTSSFKEWFSTMQTHHPLIYTTHITRPDQPVYAAIIIGDLSVSEDSIQHYRIDFAVIQPDGKELYRGNNFRNVRMQATSAKGLLLVDPILIIVLEKDDPRGKYKVQATLYDLIAGLRSTDTFDLELIP